MKRLFLIAMVILGSLLPALGRSTPVTRANEYCCSDFEAAAYCSEAGDGRAQVIFYCICMDLSGNVRVAICH
jgi:hypothetical protein